MPVRKYRDLDEARRDLWIAPGDPGLAARIRRLWAFAARLAPPDVPRGVRKFRSIEEANKDPDEWVRRRVRLLRQQRLGHT
jgi:hypothetical protein